MELYQ